MEPDRSLTPSSSEVAAFRARVLARFEAWLDQALAQPEPPSGLAAEILAEMDHERVADEGTPAGREADIYGLWSALTALTQEVKLQGRFFKELKEELSSRGQAAGGGGDQAAGGPPLARARREMIEVLVDLRDRLARATGAARAQLAEAEREFAPSWLGRLLRPGRLRGAQGLLDAVRALEEGSAMSMRHLDDILGDLEVREIACLGRPFDPRRMAAVAIEETALHPEGEVVEVIRPGYEWGGDLFRAAQVKVARAPAGDVPGDSRHEAQER